MSQLPLFVARPEPDARAPSDAPAWWSWALDCAERAVARGCCAGWNARVAADIRRRWRWV